MTLPPDGAAVDERGRLTMQGLVHRVHVRPNDSIYDPLSLAIERGGEYTIALLAQEHIDALYAFLADHVSPEVREQPTR